MTTRLLAWLVAATAPLGPGAWDAAAADTPQGASAGAPASVEYARGRVDLPGGIIQLAAQRDGIIKEILVDEGHDVKRGDVLAVLDDVSARLNLEVVQREQAQAEAAQPRLLLRKAAAERERRRLQALVAKGLAQAAELDQAADIVAQLAAEAGEVAAAVDAARARTAVARYEVELRLIRAPMDGRVIRRLAKPGEGSSTLNVTPLFWFAPAGPRIVRAELEEGAVRTVHVGQRAEIISEFDAGIVYAARVARVGELFGPKRPITDDPTERQDVRVVECVLTLDADGAPLLIGQRVTVRFLDERRAGP